MIRRTLIALLCAQAFGAGAACYTVHNKDGTMIYRADESPVDMRRPLGETVPAKFGTGATMMFSLTDTDCPRADTPAATVGGDPMSAGLTKSYLERIPTMGQGGSAVPAASPSESLRARR